MKNNDIGEILGHFYWDILNIRKGAKDMIIV